MARREDSGTQARPNFTELNDLISERNGGKVLFATDEWFAPSENLVKAGEPEWRPDAFTDSGKWMDGWETRRRRVPGHDWVIIRLGVPGVLHGLIVDTAFFTGNYAPRFSLQAANLTPQEEADIPHWKSMLGGAATPKMLKQISRLQSEDWEVLVPMMSLHAGYEDTRYNYYTIDNKGSWTHIRLNIYPDGGIARLRLYGEAHPNWKDVSSDTLTDLIAMVNGGACLAYSDAHYGHPRNIIRPGRGVNMGDGWETARQLDRPSILEADSSGVLQMPGCEWAVFQLGHCGYIAHIEVDTYHFKGNYPDSIRIEGTTEKPRADWRHATWHTLLPPQKLCPHMQHFYKEKDLETKGPFMYVRVTIAPDGGISRLRLWGYCHNST